MYLPLKTNCNFIQIQIRKYTVKHWVNGTCVLLQGVKVYFVKALYYEGILKFVT